MSDARPFPIQGEGHHIAPCTVPWWLAQEAYAYYSSRFGREQSLERIAERGGFGREELVAFLRRELPRCAS